MTDYRPLFQGRGRRPCACMHAYTVVVKSSLPLPPSPPCVLTVRVLQAGQTAGSRMRGRRRASGRGYMSAPGRTSSASCWSGLACPACDASLLCTRRRPRSRASSASAMSRASSSCREEPVRSSFSGAACTEKLVRSSLQGEACMESPSSSYHRSSHHCISPTPSPLAYHAAASHAWRSLRSSLRPLKPFVGPRRRCKHARPWLVRAARPCCALSPARLPRISAAVCMGTIHWAGPGTAGQEPSRGRRAGGGVCLQSQLAWQSNGKSAGPRAVCAWQIQAFHVFLPICCGHTHEVSGHSAAGHSVLCQGSLYLQLPP